MYIVGIDIGKNHHEASIIDSSGKLIGRSCHFSNTHKGSDKLMEHINKNIGNYFLNTKNIFPFFEATHQWAETYITPD